MEMDLNLPCKFTYFHVKNEENIKIFRIKEIEDAESAKAWIEEFSNLNFMIWRVLKTYPNCKNRDYIYRKDFRCHYCTDKRAVGSRSSKNTDCPARLIIKINRSTDIHLNEFPMTVILHHRHNHLIDYDLEKRFLDRLKPPEFIPLLKQPEGPSMVQNLQAYIAEYNAQRQGRFAELTVHDEENFFVVLVSPLMKRVLERVPETEKVLFADSTVKIESYNSKLFLLLTDSSFGGLPVGCILTTSDQEDILDRALESFKSFLSSKCFGGQGELGPKVIMTDDRGSGKQSFRKAFPSSIVSVCTYRVLQTLWRFTMDDNTGIHRERRLDFFCLLQQMVCCSSKEQLARFYDNVMTCPSTSTYPKYISYVYNMYGGRKEWAKCFRGKRKQVDQTTSRVCEPAMRMVRENISKWKKALSVTELFHSIASDTDSFYENHLVTIANGRPISYLRRNFKPEDFSSEKVGPNSYIIRSTKANRLFCVDSEIGICSCMTGKFGGMCKHQILVSSKDDDESRLQPDPVLKADLLFIATGRSDNFNTLHSKLVSGENQSQEIGKNLNRTEFNCSMVSSISSPDLDEMNDNEEQVVEMVIAYEDEDSSTFTDQMLEAKLPVLSKEQNNALEGLSTIQSGVQPMLEQKVTMIESMEASLESSVGTSVLNSLISPANAEVKRVEMKIELKAVFDDILLKMHQSNSTLQAVEDFVRNYTTLNCETALNSALRSFGKFNDAIS